MNFLITNKSLPDNPRLQDFDESVPLRHFWRSVAIAFFVAMMISGHFVMDVFIVVCMNLYMSIGDCVMLRFIAKNSDRHDFIHFANGSLHMRHKAGV